MQPIPIEIDALVRGMYELIKATVGPEVEIRLRLREVVWSALCDANQLESVLLDLAINARDAMPNGGTLTIVTADRLLARADLTDQDDVKPGDYGKIAGPDTGTGMSPRVLAQAFEPFFTTKPNGQGTGLGLSQTYGFVANRVGSSGLRAS